MANQYVRCDLRDNLTDYWRPTATARGKVEVAQINIQTKNNMGKLLPGGWIQIVQPEKRGEAGKPPVVLLNIPPNWEVKRLPYNSGDKGLGDYDHRHVDPSVRESYGY